MINIALDVGVGRKRAKQLEEMGYKVVCVANHGEPDEQWMDRAFTSNALFVISPDFDIPRIIEKEGYPMSWIDFPSNTPELKFSLVDYINNRISLKLRMFKMVGGE